MTQEVPNNSKTQEGEMQIPDHALESLARRLYPAILAYYETEEGQREFVEWKKQQEKKKLS